MAAEDDVAWLLLAYMHIILVNWPRNLLRITWCFCFFRYRAYYLIQALHKYFGFGHVNTALLFCHAFMGLKFSQKSNVLPGQWKGAVFGSYLNFKVLLHLLYLYWNFLWSFLLPWDFVLYNSHYLIKSSRQPCWVLNNFLFW